MSSDICPAGVPLNKPLPSSFAVDVMCVWCVLSYEIRKKKTLFTQMQLIWNSPLQVCAFFWRKKDVKKNEGKQIDRQKRKWLRLHALLSLLVPSSLSAFRLRYHCKFPLGLNQGNGNWRLVTRFCIMPLISRSVWERCRWGDDRAGPTGFTWDFVSS